MFGKISLGKDAMVKRFRGPLDCSHLHSRKKIGPGIPGPMRKI
jgi:hypothetical protein